MSEDVLANNLDPQGDPSVILPVVYRQTKRGLVAANQLLSANPGPDCAKAFVVLSYATHIVGPLLVDDGPLDHLLTAARIGLSGSGYYDGNVQGPHAHAVALQAMSAVYGSTVAGRSRFLKVGAYDLTPEQWKSVCRDVDDYRCSAGFLLSTARVLNDLKLEFVFVMAQLPERVGPNPDVVVQGRREGPDDRSAGGWTGQAQGGSRPGANSPATESLSNTEYKILLALRDARPRRLFLVDLAGDRSIRAGNKKCGQTVNTLIERGLASRPEGEHGGITITSAGLALLETAGN